MPAEWVARVFVAAGVEASRVAVVGHGAPADACGAPPVGGPSAGSTPTRDGSSSSAGGRPFRVLFHGGALWRKGVDLLLAAWAAAFGPSDGAELVLHASYGDADVFAFLERELERRRARHAPVRLLRQRLTAAELDDLFASADLLVHPSRSEGFGLGLLDAMARGIPAVLPAYGPPLEFVSNGTGFLFPAASARCARPPCARDSRSVFTVDWATDAPLAWGEYEPAALAAALRFAFERPEEVAARGAAARAHVCADLAWERVYAGMRPRLEALAARAAS